LEVIVFNIREADRESVPKMCPILKLILTANPIQTGGFCPHGL